jgi:LacI family transcriptional regulator
MVKYICKIRKGVIKMTKVTIYDVANFAGVSIATVSRVINGSNKVRATTAMRVSKAIEVLNFTPDVNAVKLANKRVE